MESLNRTWELLVAERAILFWLIPLLLALIALYLLGPTIKAWAARRRLDAIVARLGPESLSGVVLDDGMDGLVHIDRLVAGPRGLRSKGAGSIRPNRRRVVFCARTWTPSWTTPGSASRNSCENSRA